MTIRINKGLKYDNNVLFYINDHSYYLKQVQFLNYIGHVLYIFYIMLSTLAKFLFTKIWRWKIDGEYPINEKKFIIVVAPHTSFHDVPIGILFRTWYQVPIKFIIKADFFKNPILKRFFNFIGGIPVDRSKSNNFVDAVVDIFNERKELAIAITPEGTRKKVEKFKSGFYYIAQKAKIPILPIAFDFEHKVIIINPFYYPSEHAKNDILAIEALYKGVKGKHPKRSFT